MNQSDIMLYKSVKVQLDDDPPVEIKFECTRRLAIDSIILQKQMENVFRINESQKKILESSVKDVCSIPVLSKKPVKKFVVSGKK